MPPERTFRKAADRSRPRDASNCRRRSHHRSQASMDAQAQAQAQADDANRQKEQAQSDTAQAKSDTAANQAYPLAVTAAQAVATGLA
jgi:hypothetical protein